MVIYNPCKKKKGGDWEKIILDFARKKISKFIEILKNDAPIKIEKELKREQRGLTMIVSRQ